MSDRKKRFYHQFCGVARTLDFVGERWTLLIIRDLLLGPKRYSDLLGGLPKLTTNLLARRLKDLEEDGLIEKAKLPPPNSAFVYQLTALGRGLEPLVIACSDWGSRFLTQPSEEEKVDFAWCLLRLKPLYKGGQNLIFELKVEHRIYHVVLRADSIQVRDGRHPECELMITGSYEDIHKLFFGPGLASDLANGREIVVEGKFGRWPRLLASFGLS